MKQTIVAAHLLLAPAPGPAVTSALAFDDSRLAIGAATQAVDSVRAYLAAAESRGFSGVVLIARSDTVLVHCAASRDPAITTSTAFWIGSLTKSMAAAAVLKLQEQGKLTVADPISRHLPRVPEDKRSITIHHLLTQGLGPHFQQMR